MCIRDRSYKCHKKIKHTPDQWKVFEDTHEAIIDKETFEIVQKIRAGKDVYKRQVQTLRAAANPFFVAGNRGIVVGYPLFGRFAFYRSD